VRGSAVKGTFFSAGGRLLALALAAKTYSVRPIDLVFSKAG